MEGVTRCSSLPSVASPDAVIKVPPVPVPRMFSNSHQEGRTDCLESSTPTPGVTLNVTLDDSIKTNSCHDVNIRRVRADPCARENNNMQVDVVNTGNRYSVCCMSPVKMAAPADKGVTQPGRAKPAKPPRPKRLQQKELALGADVSDRENISRATKTVSVARAESVDGSETSGVQQHRSTPQPKPRYSLLLSKSAELQGLETDRFSSKLLHSASCEFKNCEKTPVNSDTKSCRFSRGIIPAQLENGRKADDMGAEQNGCKPANCIGDIDSAKSKPGRPEKGNMTAAVHSSSGLIPSRTAPPRPTVPKITVCSFSDVVQLPSNGTDGDSQMLSNNGCISNEVQAPSSNSQFVAAERQVEAKEHFADSAPVKSPVSDGPGECPSTSSTQSVVLSQSIPTDIVSLSEVNPENADKGNKVRNPAVPVKKKRPKTSQSLSCDVSSSSDVLQGDTKIVHSDSSARRRRSEAIASSGNCSGPQNLSAMEDDLGDVRRNLVSRESTNLLTDTDSVFVSTPLNSPQSRLSQGIAETPPITPSALGFDANDDKERKVCGVFTI